MEKGHIFYVVFSLFSVSEFLSGFFFFKCNLVGLSKGRQCGKIMEMFTWVRHINVCIIFTGLNQSPNHRVGRECFGFNGKLRFRKMIIVVVDDDDA